MHGIALSPKGTAAKVVNTDARNRRRSDASIDVTEGPKLSRNKFRELTRELYRVNAERRDRRIDTSPTRLNQSAGDAGQLLSQILCRSKSLSFRRERGLNDFIDTVITIDQCLNALIVVWPRQVARYDFVEQYPACINVLLGRTVLGVQMHFMRNVRRSADKCRRQGLVVEIIK